MVHGCGRMAASSMLRNWLLSHACKLSPHTYLVLIPLQARLLYEFAPVLAGLVPDLLPAVLMLLRTKAREVIKSVLGFVKVRAGGVGQLLLRMSCGEMRERL